jgi:hypothetical protein
MIQVKIKYDKQTKDIKCPLLFYANIIQLHSQ